DFTTLPLLLPDRRGETLKDSYATLRDHWQSMTDEMLALEEENNRIFIDTYGLADDLSHKVPIEEITLTCNPAYRYGVKGSEENRETRLREDTVAEFLHYAVGCMFGRYSLDAPGLILANQGEVIEDYRNLQLSLRAHPLSFVRDELTRRGVTRCADLASVRDGRHVEVAGIILVRQKPGSAKGVLFITIEDETGIANGILWPDRFEAQRRTVMSASMVGLKGRVQKEGEVIHVICDRIVDHGDLLHRV
ncbi:OB-fold nucleic acid binding domain-containing protein, partial [Pseudomonas sp. EA_65y_Pfl1_P113]|uniref:OB-fold nucleic acid binding domain-containing protein n=1 Tax=Pseudomonas sp. EA_65y_Pfl1_P113 TaxID=3088692 RepID=UPI0030D73C58